MHAGSILKIGDVGEQEPNKVIQGDKTPTQKLWHGVHWFKRAGVNQLQCVCVCVYIHYVEKRVRVVCHGEMSCV